MLLALNSLKNPVSLAEITQPHSTNIAGNFNFDSYDGSISTDGVRELDCDLDFVCSSTTLAIMRTKMSTVSTFDDFPNKLLVKAPVLFVSPTGEINDAFSNTWDRHWHCTQALQRIGAGRLLWFLTAPHSNTR